MRRADEKLYPMKMGEAAKRGDRRDDARATPILSY
jgi:hypothetical protein